MAEPDTPELEALFDSILDGHANVVPKEAAAAGDQMLFERIGQLTRQLHDTLKELGYDQVLESTLHSIPDARDRLVYVSNITEQAARRVLDATDLAEPHQATLAEEMVALGARWDQLLNGQLDVNAFRLLAWKTHLFLTTNGPAHVAATRTQLSKIMLAQDFQDLTGQVIRKIIVMAQSLEQGLLGLLVDARPATDGTALPAGLINGPVVKTEGRDDVVTSQQQADDLLASLGF